MSVVAVVAREHRRGREKKRETQAGTSHESLLFSRYPRLGAIVIDWRCGTSPDLLYPSLFLSPSFSSFLLPFLSFFLSSTLACYIDSLFIVWQPPCAEYEGMCTDTLSRAGGTNNMHTCGTHTHTHTQNG